MSNASDRLKQAREKAGFQDAAEAARRFGWAASTYHGHENGSRGLRADVAQKYARAFRVSPDWLMFGKGDDMTGPADDAPESDLVPIYDIEASAGNGIIPGEDEAVVDHLALPPGYLRRITSAPVSALAIVTVTGDSMSPTLRGGDVVMIDTRKQNPGYDGLFVLRFDGALHVKRMNRGSRPGVVRIVSDNPVGYAPFEREMHDVEVVGKVLWYGRKE